MSGAAAFSVAQPRLRSGAQGQWRLLKTHLRFTYTGREARGRQ
jgi:hypothetical protein